MKHVGNTRIFPYCCSTLPFPYNCRCSLSLIHERWLQVVCAWGLQYGLGCADGEVCKTFRKIDQLHSTISRTENTDFFQFYRTWSTSSRSQWPHGLLFFSHGARLSPHGTAPTVWPIVPAPGDRWYVWSSRRNKNWQGKPKYSEKTCPSAILSTTNSTWPYPGSNPGRGAGKPATNSLSYGAASFAVEGMRYLRSLEHWDRGFESW
jgi:hypothetical protein